MGSDHPSPTTLIDGYEEYAPGRYRKAAPGAAPAVVQQSLSTAAPDTATDRKRESEIQRDCERLLTHYSIEHLHLSPRAREKAGWPDLVFCYRGQPWAVELKQPGKLPTAEQVACLSRLEANGWRVAVAYSAAELLEILTGRNMAGEAAWTAVTRWRKIAAKAEGKAQ